jgi:hypothetical protein
LTATIVNNSFNYSKEGEKLIVHEPSQTLFNFTELTLNEFIGSVLPDAQFLFANLKQLTISYNDMNVPIKDMAAIIKHFEHININKKLERVDIQLRKS